MAPCIIFIDEIDTIGKSRDNRMGGNDEREQTLNQLLAELDGFDPGKGVIVLGATNRPEVLDQALLRPGRFDRRITIDRPNLAGRLATLQVHTRRIKLAEDVDLRKIALATAGTVGADLANLVNEAALRAVRMGRKTVNQADLLASLNRSRTRLAPTPTNISTKSEPEMEKKGTPASPATALASRVLPVPGGPTSRAPLGSLAPISVYFWGLWRMSMISWRDSLASSWPATSRKVTPVFFST